ncbi:MAG: MgtC/SapB family protein [Puniceicoccaceae bacterium]
MIEMDWMEELAVAGNVLLAMLLGGLMGWEREAAEKPAGLRTHMLVAGAATLFVSLGGALIVHFNATENEQIIRADPIRIVEAILVGVSFLGAGTIIRPGGGSGRVHGLTTAASLLLAASIGISVAVGKYLLAVCVALTGLAILRLMNRLECKADLKPQPESNP